MMQSEQKIDESEYSENEPKITDGERALILLKTETEKKLDQTVSTPERYTSRYHYNTKNIDKYIQLCPHCKKPTLSAFDRTVIDSAVDYLNGKRILKSYQRSPGNFLQSILIIVAFSTVAYFIASRI